MELPHLRPDAWTYSFSFHSWVEPLYSAEESDAFSSSVWNRLLLYYILYYNFNNSSMNTGAWHLLLEPDDIAYPLRLEALILTEPACFITDIDWFSPSCQAEDEYSALQEHLGKEEAKVDSTNRSISKGLVHHGFHWYHWLVKNF